MITSHLVPLQEQDNKVVVISTIANILEHHAPDTNSDARTLLSLCRPLVEEHKSSRILDGCVSLVLYRFREHIRQRRPGEGMHWLVIGLEMESLILSACPEQGSCYRAMARACQTTVINLLQSLDKNYTVDESTLKEMETAREMVTSLKDSSSSAPVSDKFIRNIREVRQLDCVLSMFNALIQGGSENFAHAATDLVLCLQYNKDNDNNSNGGSIPLLPYSMHWPLLQVAGSILAEEELKIREEDGLCTETNTALAAVSAFSKEGIVVLMECLNQICLMESDFPSEKDADELRAALAKALARAFLVENSKKQKQGFSPPWATESIRGKLSVNLARYETNSQERVVQKMLDY